MNTTRVTSGDDARGSTKVRITESKTRMRREIPQREPQDLGQHVHPVQLRRLRPIERRGQSSGSGRRRSCLRVDWRRLASSRALLRRLRRLRRPAGGGSTCSATSSRDAQSFEGELPVARLRARVGRVARATGPMRSSSRSRCRGANDVDVAIGNRTSTRVSDVLACWPPGPPEPVVRHSSSSRRITHVEFTRRTPRSVTGAPGSRAPVSATVG